MEEAISTKTQLLYGTHAVLAALKNPERQHKKLWLSPKTAESLASILPKTLRPQVVKPDFFKSKLGENVVHQGLLLETTPLPLLSLNTLLEKFPEGPYIALDQVTDPQNGGALLRSARALGATAIILTQRHSFDPLSPILAKNASGALESLPLCQVTNLSQCLQNLDKAGFETIGLSEEGAPLDKTSFTPQQTCLVMGAEGKGLRKLTRERVHGLYRLPTSGSFGTLNVSVATALSLYIIGKQ